MNEGCSLLALPLFVSFNWCFFFVFVFFSLIIVKNIETKTNMAGFFPTPLHPVQDGHLFSQPAEAEESWNEDSEGHQDGKHEAAVVRGIGVGCAGA